MKNGCEPWCNVKLYVVPARVAGNWRLPQGELVLEQNFQMLRGTLSANGVKTELPKARMDGERISFSAGEVQYSGRVLGNRIEGVRAAGAGLPAGAWTAFRQ
ncbi:MAG: hypothetical protein FJY55_16120 [Betaproteobacteria bacterium]|nr:hypothetical protein [Betaproteobacteria bacterium]